MTGLVSRIENAAWDAAMGLINAGVTLKKGVLRVCEEGSYIMYDIYDLDGLEKWTKATIANLKLISHIPAIKGIFFELLKTLEAQKDLYYATKVIGSMNQFIKIDNKGQISLTLPEFTEILYGIANVCDTGRFLQKYGVFSFDACSRIASKLASTQILNTSYHLGDVHVVRSLFGVEGQPKDFFIFIASGIKATKCMKNFKKWYFSKEENKKFDWENAFKWVDSVGKMLLITLGPKYGKKAWFSGIDSATQLASLFAFILKKHRERHERFSNPEAHYKNTYSGVLGG